MTRRKTLVVAFAAAAVATAAGLLAAWLMHVRAEEKAETEREALYRQFGISASGKKRFVPMPPILTHHGSRALLGQQLFNDRRLACSQRLVCGACHWLGAGGTDSRIHHGKITRPVHNAVFATCYMHDGGISNLHDVVRTMIVTPYFCGGNSLDVALSRLSADAPLVKRFESAYQGKGGLNGTNLVDSVVEYMKTLITSGTPYDFWCAGHENRLTAEARRGSEVFLSARCIDCHDGPALGARKVSKGHKVPALRGLSLRNAYLSDGKEKKLENVVPLMPGGDLPQEDMAALLAFLGAL